MIIINNRIDEFKIGEKDVVFIDFSNYTHEEEFKTLIELFKPIIRKYPHNSIYTITSMEGVELNSKSHDLISEAAEHNRPYVKFGVVYGVEGVKKILAKTITIVSGRTNLEYLSSKEEAIDYLTNLKES